MSIAFVEYKRFLKKYSKNFSSYETKLARMILENFELINGSSSAGGRRAKLIADLVSEHGQEIEGELLLNETPVVMEKEKFKRLSKLIIKNFRGFSDEQIFEFNNPYTFVYGPNGSGKTSFCESLEYALLGSIQEANEKRINLDKYIKNMDTGQSEPPILKGITSEGIEITVQAQPEENEFCFIERNRIEGFARVSANTPGDQQRRLASLFGLEEFNAFVSNFNERIDNYLDCKGVLKQKLVDKEKQVESYENTLKTIPQERKEINDKISALLEQYPSATSLDVLKEQLSGTKEIKGLIQKNNDQIAILAKGKVESDPGIEKLISRVHTLDSLTKERNETEKSLQKYKSEMLLKDLYTAILQNKESFHNVCPACESELFIDGELAVPLNPYSNATSKIREFEKAIKLEERINEINRQIRNEINSIKTKIIEILTLAEAINFPSKVKVLTIKQLILGLEETDKELSVAVSIILGKLNILTELKKHLDGYNKEVTERQSKINKINEENQLFDATLHEITRIQTMSKAIDDNEMKAKSAIDKFKQENEKLIKQVEQETILVEENLNYHQAYISLKTRLVEYNKELPSLLASDLSEKTKEFYNAINKYDHPSDLLEEIRLPSNSGQKIIIRFKNGVNLDALHVLSEGHIRCLGLSILLAKNVQDNVPILVFDDVVNAIDDEHRRGIIETILEEESIKNKQLIITTHGEEFVKQLENYIPKKDYKKMVTRIDFLKPEGIKKINIKLEQSRNYLILAESRLESGQIRDSLANARRALENSMNRLWKKIAKRYNVQLSVSLRLPERPPELMSLAQSLKKYISKNLEGYEDVTSSLEVLLGMERRHSLEWNYLNKGTHDEDRIEEFDRTVVKEMIELLTQIDDVIAESKF